MPYFIYNLVLTLAFLLVLPFVPVVVAAGDRYRRGLWQRLGFYPPAVRHCFLGRHRPVWIHAASVGEVRSVKVLTEELKRRFPDRRIILLTFTYTGNLLAHENHAVDAVVFLPLDLWWVVRRALAIVDPAIMIFIETEIWPNLLQQAYRKGIPTVLLSGRISSKGLVKYRRFKWLFRRVLQRLKACGMQSEVDLQRIISLGAPRERVSITGSLKQSARSDHDTLSHVEEPQYGSGFLWVVGSSHRGEEEIVLNAFQSLRENFRELRLVLAPRHPQRFSEVEKLLISKGLSFDKKSQINGAVTFQSDLLLLDSIGDLDNFYAIGDVAFVGGSLIDAGGHNLLEPARWHKPLLFGPYTSNVNLLANALKEQGGGFEVHDEEDLVRELTRLLQEPQARQMAGENAYRIAFSERSVLEASLALIVRYLPATNK